MIVLANVLQPLVDFAEAILKFWHDQIGLNWGLSIVGLTVVVRLLILPLTFKQVRAMQELQRLQPEIKRIQERYKDDRQRMNEEMMKFYREHKVNPLGSCLPLLLQLPFFISLFYLLRGDAFQKDIRGEEAFLFIPDLAKPVTDHPGVLVTLIVIYVVTQLGASLVTALSADKNQRRLMLALPFVFVIFIVNFEAGLIVYWITTNVWTVGQQLLVKKLLPRPEPLVAGASATVSKPARGKPPTPAAVAAGEGGGGNPSRPQGGARKAPPPSPRKRKRKRSGRRR